MDEDVPEWGKDYGSKSKKSKKTSKKAQDSPFIQPRNNGNAYGSRENVSDGWGGRNDGYSNGNGNGSGNGSGNAARKPKTNGEPDWNHEF